jgi:hypothetical protein
MIKNIKTKNKNKQKIPKKKQKLFFFQQVRENRTHILLADVVEGARHRLNDWSCIVVYCIVIHIFLLFSKENNRAIYPCICTLSIKRILH